MQAIVATRRRDILVTDFEIRDAVLDVETADLLVVVGESDGTLEPAQFMILAAGLRTERTIRTQTRVTAAPLNADGEVPEKRTVSSTNAAVVQQSTRAVRPGSATLSRPARPRPPVRCFLVVLAGIVIPPMWIPFLGLIYLGWRRGCLDRAAGAADRETFAPATG